MRLCRYLLHDEPRAGFYVDSSIVPLHSARAAFCEQTASALKLPDDDDLLQLAGPHSPYRGAVLALYRWLVGQETAQISDISVDRQRIHLLTPIARPPKLLLLAGNYAAHIKEDGSQAEERRDTFPYVFMKPPTTTLLNPDDPFRIPPISPRHIDWEVELAVIIGAHARNLDEASALSAVAGYTVLNDISDRRFRPNPERKTRDWDKFFDWMHGKWHDGSAPCGPCMVTPESVPDPQSLEMQLTLNGELRQRGNTADQVFSLPAVIAFVSSFVTLEPGDIISTGTPAGVGSTTNTFLKPGDTLAASIESIGELKTAVAAPAS